MQKLILFFIFVPYAFAAPIDKAFFEGDNVVQYYQQIEKDINSSISKKLKGSKVTALEQSTLKKLKDLYTIKLELKQFEPIRFPHYTITEEEYLHALYLLEDISSEIKRLEEKEKEFQGKLFALKSTIEKTLPNDKANTLLSNQMQYAFYKISKDKISKSLTLYHELFQKEFHKFQQALPRVEFHKPKQVHKIIKFVEQKIDSLQKKDFLLNIDKDTESLRHDKDQKKIIQAAKNIQQETDETLIKKIETHILVALKCIKQKNQKEFISVLEKIEKDIQQLSPGAKKTYNDISKLLMDFGDEHFDSASVAIASTRMGLQNIISSITQFSTKTLFVYEEKAFSVETILTFIIILIVGSFIAKIYKNFIDSFRKTNRIKSLSTARMIANSGYYLIILSTFFIALKTIGLDIHTIFIVVGAILLWIAFGLQSFISNYAMGILLKIDRSIRIGDHIELDAGTVGDVDDMDFRSVTIRSSDNIRTTVPNSRFISGTFINHTFEGTSRRLEIDFSANKLIPHHHISETILEALQHSDIPHFKTKMKKPEVIIVDINRKIVRYALLVWVHKESTYDMSVARSQFLKLIHQSLYSESKSLEKS